MEKKIKKISNDILITTAFYISLAFLPVFINKSSAIDIMYRMFFFTSPLNYLLYICPLVMLFFVRKKQPRDAEAYLLLTDLLVLCCMIFDYSHSSGFFIHATVALLVLSVICISTNEMVALLILVPGLFLSKLGLGFVITVYIPVLLLLLLQPLQNAPSDSNGNKTEKQKIPLIIPAYFYITVLTVILFIAGKLPTQSYHAMAPLNFYDIVRIIAGFILVAAAIFLFILKVLPVMKQSGIKEKILLITYAVYPLIFLIINKLTFAFSPDFNSYISVALLMYVMGCLRADMIFGEKCSPLVPEKLKNEPFTLIIATFFCIFSFLA